jgi:carotenoid cleavage dioxygenase-like enzyme
MVDPFVPPHPDNVPIDGDGNISAFQFHNGKVDLKTRYIDTERLKLERKANKAMFGLYRNPFTHHPCVRYAYLQNRAGPRYQADDSHSAAVDSTANTNLVHWGGHLLALKEVALVSLCAEGLLDSSLTSLHSRMQSTHVRWRPEATIPLAK